MRVLSLFRIRVALNFVVKQELHIYLFMLSSNIKWLGNVSMHI
jgi:hypothetical protein